MKWIGGLLFGAGAVMFASPFLSSLSRLSLKLPGCRNALIGAVVFTVIWLLFRRKLEFFFTFEHELTHLITALLCFKRPSQFMVHESGNGMVQTYGGNFLISLTPYFVPTPALVLLALGLFVDRRHSSWFMMLFGAALAFHVISTAGETRHWQPDIQRWGVFFAAVIILAGNIVLVGVCVRFLTSGYPGVTAFFREGWQWGRVTLLSMGA